MQVNDNGVKPVKQVAAEMFFLYHLFEVLVRGRNKAYIYFYYLIAPQPLELSLLEHPKELCLHSQRHVAYLIQKERAAVGHLKLTLFLFIGPRKRTLFIPKKFTLKQVFRKCSTVYLHVRLGVAPAGVMDGIRHHFFPRTAASHGKHRGVRSGDFFDGIHHPLDSSRISYNILVAVLFLQLPLQEPRLVLKGLKLDYLQIGRLF